MQRRAQACSRTPLSAEASATEKLEPWRRTSHLRHTPQFQRIPWFSPSMAVSVHPQLVNGLILKAWRREYDGRDPESNSFKQDLTHVPVSSVLPLQHLSSCSGGNFFFSFQKAGCSGERKMTFDGAKAEASLPGKCFVSICCQWPTSNLGSPDHFERLQLFLLCSQSRVGRPLSFTFASSSWQILKSILAAHPDISPRFCMLCFL